MNVQKVNGPNSIISDSFLRSYSISRIIRINQQNRNRTKVIIMKKIKALKDECRKQGMYSPLQSMQAQKNSPKANDLSKMKQKITKILSRKSVQSRFKKNKKLLNEIKEEADIPVNTSSVTKLSAQKASNTNFHRRFKSDAIQSQTTKTEPFKIRSKANSQEHLKAELRMSEIKFQKVFKKQRSHQQSLHQEENESTEYTSSLSTTLNSFNRLRLMKNAKGSQKIMKHFYKRSLENCSLEDLKYLLKIEANSKEEDDRQEGQNMLPMRFGKTEALKRGYFTPSEPATNKENEEKKTSVWNNQVLRKNCGFYENYEILNLSQTKSHLNSTNCEKLNKTKKYYTKHCSAYEQKQNCFQLLSVTQKNERDLQIETSLVYLYNGKRFPINQNKLNGIYENWQKEYIKKKRVQDLMENSHLNHMYQHREIKIDSIKLKKPSSEINKPKNESVELSQPYAKGLSMQKLQFQTVTEKEVHENQTQV